MSQSYMTEPLAPTHDRAGFSAGVEPLDRYLKQQARQDMEKFVAAVFVHCLPGRHVIVGYYTLCATAIQLAEIPDEEHIKRKLPRYPYLPAALIGRLAVDARYQGQRFGVRLLIDALKRSLHTDLAARAVVVDAKDEQARQFYEKYDFRRFADHEFRLYLPIKTIQGLFRQD